MSLLNILQEEELGGVLQKYLVPVQFPQNSCIMRQGDIGEGCYLIDEGTVRLEVKNIETDTDGVIGFVEPPMFVGEFSLLEEKPREATAYAHTYVKARYFSKASYAEIAEKYPWIGLTITTTLAQNLIEKLRKANDKVAGYIFAGDIDIDTNEMVARAQKEQREFSSWPEERINAMIKDIAETVAEKADELAAATVAETKMGIVADKVMKIRFASLDVFKAISGHAAAGFLTDPENRIVEIACPVGVVFGIIPVTNPVATIVFKTLICLKGRNAVILSCHRDALGVGTKTCDLIRGVLERHGASKDLVQPVLHRSSRQKTIMFMNHPGISLILATGGTSMVKAAYSSGTPAIGVGSGNAPVLICADADIAKAAQNIVTGKSFDNGIICGSENNLIVVSKVRDEFVKELESAGAIILTPDEKNRFTSQVFETDTGGLKRNIIGKSAKFIAEQASIKRDREFRIIVVPLKFSEIEGPYGHEKLAPILSLVTVRDEDEGITMAKRILHNQGRGHTAVIHTKNADLMRRFGREIDASRILTNVPSSYGCVGIGSGLTPSFTLGCGTFGGTSTTDNVTYMHVLNIKRLSQNF